MTSLLNLWLPIVLSAVLVFVVSSVLHMALTYHRADYRPLPDEEKALVPLRDANLAPGLYTFPYCVSHKEMEKPEVKARLEKGPVGMLTVLPSGLPKMGKYLSLWLGYTLVIGLFVAYLTSRTLPPGTHYLQVFRVAGTTAFMAYGIGQLSDSIWKALPWGNTIRAVADGLVYALVTAGVFGWLWPR